MASPSRPAAPSANGAKPKRVMTSAIPDKSVTDVRKGLAEVRLMARRNSPEMAMYFTDPLQSVGMSVAQFCMQHVQGQHIKRNKKGKAAGGGAHSHGQPDSAESSPASSYPAQLLQPYAAGQRV